MAGEVGFSKCFFCVVSVWCGLEEITTECDEDFELVLVHGVDGFYDIVSVFSW